jgi:hypothetical protein
VCDVVVHGGTGYQSASPVDAPDMAITRFRDGTWAVYLPMAIGDGLTLPDAMRNARRAQHLALQLEREQAIHDATTEHYAARAARLLHAGAANDGEWS